MSKRRAGAIRNGDGAVKILAQIAMGICIAGSLAGCVQPPHPEEVELQRLWREHPALMSRLQQQEEQDAAQRDIDSMTVSHDSYTDDDGMTTFTQTICSLSGCSTSPW